MPGDIDMRDIEVSDDITTIFNKWLKDYEPVTAAPVKPVPTPEQEEQIRQLRALGLIP